MDTFTIVIFLVVTVVLAVAIIALAIWVAVISGRMKKTLDKAFAEPMRSEPPQQAPQNQAPPMRSMPSSASQASGPYAPIPAQHPQAGRHASPQGYGSSMRQQPINLANVDEYDYMSRRDGMSNRDGMSSRESSAFFDNYQEQDYGAHGQGFGRRKPTIPYGKAKAPARRYDSYTESAMDSDYDPDSIDFSRVEGYKNFRP